MVCSPSGASVSISTPIGVENMVNDLVDTLHTDISWGMLPPVSPHVVASTSVGHPSGTDIDWQIRFDRSFVRPCVVFLGSIS